MTNLDPRLHALRDGNELAPTGRARVAAPVAGLFKSPDPASSLVTQALHGETVEVFETSGPWSWVRLEQDGYAGHIETRHLGELGPEPTHAVIVPKTHVYRSQTIKTDPLRLLTMNAKVAVVDIDGRFAVLASGGYIVSNHLAPVDAFAKDYVDVASRLIHSPYLWGGKSALGIDCSGLVQVSLQACGRACPRDSDMQEKALGVESGALDFRHLHRGHLVFWSGHVGIMASGSELLHANGHFMQVTREPVAAAVARIGALYGPITGVRRLVQ